MLFLSLFWYLAFQQHFVQEKVGDPALLQEAMRAFLLKAPWSFAQPKGSVLALVSASVLPISTLLHCSRMSLPHPARVVQQSWMTIKKTEISAQHEFLKPIYMCVYRFTILKYPGVQAFRDGHP